VGARPRELLSGSRHEEVVELERLFAPVDDPGREIVHAVAEGLEARGDGLGLARELAETRGGGAERRGLGSLLPADPLEIVRALRELHAHVDEEVLEAGDLLLELVVAVEVGIGAHDHDEFAVQPVELVRVVVDVGEDPGEAPEATLQPELVLAGRKVHEGRLAGKADFSHGPVEPVSELHALGFLERDLPVHEEMPVHGHPALEILAGLERDAVEPVLGDAHPPRDPHPRDLPGILPDRVAPDLGGAEGLGEGVALVVGRDQGGIRLEARFLGLDLYGRRGRGTGAHRLPFLEPFRVGRDPPFRMEPDLLERERLAVERYPQATLASGQVEPVRFVIEALGVLEVEEGPGGRLFLLGQDVDARGVAPDFLGIPPDAVQDDGLRVLERGLPVDHEADLDGHLLAGEGIVFETDLVERRFGNGHFILDPALAVRPREDVLLPRELGKDPYLGAFAPRVGCGGHGHGLRRDRLSRRLAEVALERIAPRPGKALPPDRLPRERARSERDEEEGRGADRPRGDYRA